MPFSCKSEDKVIFANDYSASEWEDIKLQVMRGTRKLTLPCCDAKASLRSGVQRRQHFAHYRNESCETDAWSDYTGRKDKRKGRKSESFDHQRVKEIIREVAVKSGWGASCEVTGSTPSGDKWTADVIACKDGLRVAFEIQVSPQQFSYYRIRQQRYKESGVKCIWLSCDVPIVSDEEIPVFELSKALGIFVIDFPIFFTPSLLRLSDDIKGLCLGEFIQLMLERRVLWDQEWGKKQDHLASLEDWRRTSKVVNEYNLDPSNSSVESPHLAVGEKSYRSMLSKWMPENVKDHSNSKRFGFKLPLKFNPQIHKYFVVFFNPNGVPVEKHPWYRSNIDACTTIIRSELPRYPSGAYAEIRVTLTNEVITKIDHA